MARRTRISQRTGEVVPARAERPQRKPTGGRRAERGGRPKKIVRDKHVLYEAAVQSPDVDVAFFRRIFRKERGREPVSLREDFCGTAAVSCEFVKVRPGNVAWAIDLDAPTLEWGDREHRARLGERAADVHLLMGDVRTARTPKVDLLCACNFSYWIFKQRAELLAYFRVVRKRLGREGILLLDAFGGSESMEPTIEPRVVSGQRAPDGSRVPRFTYEWEQGEFDVIDHGLVCRIHFELPDGTRLRNAFRYDWRMWTLPELRDLLLEAGFADVHVYAEGWDDDADESDGIFRKRARMANQPGWMAYVVALA
ncbi:MAG: class I SAM-dependent methyltransferase [Planctomycetes bacterium]|nr:class I SAM-dependent methyltransferase [Planctomycetota bacterium]